MIKYNPDSLLPFIPTQKLEEAATEFLEKYCIEALTTPMPIPIEEIIEKKMNLKIIYKNKISKDNSVFGLIAFKDGIVPMYDAETDEYVDYMIEARSIIADTSSNNYGQINNTLAHEAVHYNFHRKYFLRNKRDSIAIKCDWEKEIEDTNLNLIEWQAKNIAPKILMPLEMVKKKADELLNGPRKTFTIGDYTCDFTVSHAIQEIASFFHVSIISAYYRLKNLGYDVSDFYKDAKDIYTYYTDTAVKKLTDTKVTLEEIYDIYCKNKDFKSVIESSAFKYVDGELVFDDEAGKKIVLAFTHTSKTISSGTAFFKSSPNKVRNYVSNEDVSMAIKLYEREIESDDGSCLTFNEECRKLIEEKGWKYEDFQIYTGLSRNIFSQINNEKDSHFSNYIALAILVGLDVGLSRAEELYRKAGYGFKDDDEGKAHRIIFSTHLCLDDANSFLDSYGHKKIGVRTRSVN